MCLCLVLFGPRWQFAGKLFPVDIPHKSSFLTSLLPLIFTYRLYSVLISSPNWIHENILRIFRTFSLRQTVAGPPLRQLFPPRPECHILSAGVAKRQLQVTRGNAEHPAKTFNNKTEVEQTIAAWVASYALERPLFNLLTGNWSPPVT